MHYVQVGLMGGTVVFAILNLFTALIRRCVNQCDIEKEYNMQMAIIKKNND